MMAEKISWIVSTSWKIQKLPEQQNLILIGVLSAPGDVEKKRQSHLEKMKDE